ncbi:pancreatic lipase-related protein [Plakobranchus ocellatus]|uniref:Pancreatic lipase-related protein n=1 Tax=Plakobranchus ocellatus TaxID=259542 RepID=A0AAV3ZRD7_9GAST|nr:pancreatic lipase-related protein [Plakobranchus ocellatus]
MQVNTASCNLPAKLTIGRAITYLNTASCNLPAKLTIGRATTYLNTSFHLIGHSLGAHIMGYVGKEVYRLTNKMVGRIAGLDPAGPSFESYSQYVRLDASDATFVNVMHTDAEPLTSIGFGIRTSIGHVDFRPNGGEHQPGCPEETINIISLGSVEGPIDIIACSHSRATDLFTNSISNCRYDPPGETGSLCTMGYHTDSSCRGEFYPTTTNEQPFC